MYPPDNVIPVPAVSELRSLPRDTPEIVEFTSFAFAIDPASIVFVTVPVSSVVTKVLLVGIVVPLMLVAKATPSVGVTRVGLVANTRAPVPVSSEITPLSSEDVVDANTLSLSV